ncbi:MAG: trypsin-like peptidase domain-containing protein [Gammaproteobacteria bacterium]|nr:trypsin-like peptidase domain-containing protein [Gammaproteobacteria bacterium]
MYKQLFSLILLINFAFMGQLHADGISAAEKVYQDVNTSIFMVFDIKNHDYKKAVEYGSAVAVGKDILATNCHVALKGDEHLIKINSKLIPTTVLYVNEPQDLCLLKINQKILKPVKLRNANDVRIGEEVFTIGSPKGYERTISRGIISNKIKYNMTSILQTDAAISPGSSGGGLFDTKSHLIGITFLKNEGAGVEGIGFALPTELIAAVVNKLDSNKIVT